MDTDVGKLNTDVLAPDSSVTATSERMLRPVGVAACFESAAGWLAVLLAGLIVLVCALFQLQRMEGNALQEARTEITLQDLREQLEADLLIGLELGDSSRASEILATALSRDNELLAAEIFDAVGGMSLFSTDRGSIGEQVPSDWLEAAQRQGSAERPTAWSTSGIDSVLGIALKGPFGETAGHLALTSKPVEHIDLFTFLWIGFAVITLAFLLSCIVICVKLNAYVESYNLGGTIQSMAKRMAMTQARLEKVLEQITENVDEPI